MLLLLAVSMTFPRPTQKRPNLNPGMYSGENSSNNSFQRIPSNDNLSNGSGSWQRPPSLGNISNSSSNSGLLDTNDNMKTTAIAYLKNLKNPKCKANMLIVRYFIVCDFKNIK